MLTSHNISSIKTYIEEGRKFNCIKFIKDLIYSDLKEANSVVDQMIEQYDKNNKYISEQEIIHIIKDNFTKYKFSNDCYDLMINNITTDEILSIVRNAVEYSNSMCFDHPFQAIKILCENILKKYPNYEDFVFNYNKNMNKMIDSL